MTGITYATLKTESLPVVYLNNTEISIPSSVNTSSKFSFSFLACSKGRILSQGDELLITLEQPSNESVSYHTVLVLNLNNGAQKLLIKPSYSLDSNIFIHLEVSFNKTGIFVRLTPDSTQVASQNILVTESFFQTSIPGLKQPKNNITLGSPEFTGCVYSGTQIGIPNQIKGSCPLDNWAPCGSLGMLSVNM